jgi:hypothetical protein
MYLWYLSTFYPSRCMQPFPHFLPTASATVGRHEGPNALLIRTSAPEAFFMTPLMQWLGAQREHLVPVLAVRLGRGVIVNGRGDNSIETYSGDAAAAQCIDCNSSVGPPIMTYKGTPEMEYK